MGWEDPNVGDVVRSLEPDKESFSRGSGCSCRQFGAAGVGGQVVGMFVIFTSASKFRRMLNT